MVTVEKMYSADWCGDCRRAHAFFESHEIPYEKVDLVKDPSAWDESEKISGVRRIPVVVFSDKSFLVEPTDAQLSEKLGIQG